MPAPSNKRVEFHSLYGESIRDDARNRRICEDVIEAVEAGRSPLVLTERNEHLDSLTNQLEGRVGHVIVLRGGMGKKQRECMAAELAVVSTEKGRVILATGRYIGEGFDDARLDTLFLTLPVSWHGTIAQYAGRLHRLYDGKREVRIYRFCCRQQKSYFVEIPVMWCSDTDATAGMAFYRPNTT
jgi:superfamily II DNA or RNA helicase